MQIIISHAVTLELGGDFIHNYEHEIPMVEDIGMRKFLWSDYFHDSIISNISLDSFPQKTKWGKNLITLTIHCDRDCAKAWEALPEKVRPDDRWEFKVSDKFTYLLSFYGVEHFEIKDELCFMEYLNGRFKDTQIVRGLNANSKRPYYHFRIHITGGYMDIVFNRFKIKKAYGRVNYSTKGYLFDTASVRETVTGYKFQQPMFSIDEANDWDCFLAMQKLYRKGSPAIAAYARECLKSAMPIEDAKPYAAYVLGKVGEKSDLALVKDVYFQIKDELQKRHILDAIEILEAL